VRGRVGFVLVAALVAMVIIALLITGAFFASAQDLGIARNEIRDQQALGFAEYAIARAVEGWDAPARESMRSGQTVELAPASSGVLEAQAFVTRLDTALYAVVAESRIVSGDGFGLRRSVGIVVRTIWNGAPVNPPSRVSEQAWTALY
jgi:Tfp pilus assembly protein PilX